MNDAVERCKFVWEGKARVIVSSMLKTQDPLSWMVDWLGADIATVPALLVIVAILLLLSHFALSLSDWHLVNCKKQSLCYGPSLTGIIVQGNISSALYQK